MEERKRTTNFFANTIVTLLTRISTLFLLIFINSVIGRTIGPEGKGLVSLLLQAVTFISGLVTFGFEYSNVLFLGKEKDKIEEIYSLNWFLLVSVSLVSVPILFSLSPWILRIALKGINPFFWYLTILSVPLFTFSRLSMTIFQGLEDFKGYNGQSLIRNLSFLLAAFLFLVLLRKGLLGGALLVPIQGTAAFIFAFLYLSKKIRVKLSFNFALLKDFLRYGLKAHIGQVLQFFNYRLDFFIVNYFLNVGSVGLYAASVSIAELLWHLPSVLAITLFPRVTRLDEKESNKFSAKILRLNFTLLLLGGLFLFLLGGRLITLIFGGAFYEARAPLLFLLPGVIFLGVAKVAVGHLHGIGKPLYGTYLTLVSLGLTIILDLILIPVIGIVGAALASTLSYGVGGLLGIYWFLKTSNLPLKDILIVKREDLRELAMILKGKTFMRVEMT